jgi:hypothetical protein
VGLAGAGVAAQHDRVAGVEVGDGGRVDRRGGGVEVEIGQAFQAGEAGLVDAPGAAPLGPVVQLDAQHLGEDPEIGGLRPLGLDGEPGGVVTDAGQVQFACRGVDRRQRSSVGRCGHRAALSRRS